ncbi:MAG: hypothetical protein R3F15_19865 [Lysobacterales bacterium]
MTDDSLLTEQGRAVLEAWLALVGAEIDSDRYYGAERLVLIHLRGLQAPAAEDVFHALCRTSGDHLVAQHLHPEAPFSHGDLSWVPLLTRDGDYQADGFWMVAESGRWRLPLVSTDGLTWPLRPTGATLPVQQALQRHRQQIWGMDDETTVDCPIPPVAGLALAVADDAETLIDDGDHDWVDRDADRNLRGYLQRRALERYGNGIEQPPTPTARALQVELLYRRAFFDNGPGVGTPAWAERIRQADQALDQAVALGSDLTRLAPVLRAVALLHERGAGDLNVDPTNALKLLTLAAAAGDDEAIALRARYLAFGLDGGSSQCGSALELLQPLLARDQWDATADAAWIWLQCPDPAHRSVPQALALLEGWVDRHPWYLRNSLPDQMAEPLLAARCAAQESMATNGSEPSCVQPPSYVDAIDWQRQLFADKHARELGLQTEEIEDLPPPGSHRDEATSVVLATQLCQLPD